jgi:hypothetical protein
MILSLSEKTDQMVLFFVFSIFLGAGRDILLVQIHIIIVDRLEELLERGDRFSRTEGLATGSIDIVLGGRVPCLGFLVFVYVDRDNGRMVGADLAQDIVATAETTDGDEACIGSDRSSRAGRGSRIIVVTHRWIRSDVLGDASSLSGGVVEDVPKDASR